MKKLFLFLSVVLLMSSCGPDYKAEVAKLKQEKESILAENQSKNEEITSYIRDINEIQISIDELTSKEKLLRDMSNEGGRTSKSKILGDIDAIKLLIESNKKKISGLQYKLKNSNQKITEFEKMVESLNQQLTQKDENIITLTQEIAGLTTKLQNVEGELTAVKTENEQKSKEISEKTIKLNTAYYAVGDYKNLRESKIISNEGNIIKSKSIDPDFNSDMFTKIDVTKTQTINFNYLSKKAELVSTHPTNSYELIKDKDLVKGIQITNPDVFWASSKYLVVATK